MLQVERDYRTERYYVTLPVVDPPSYAGDMRIYLERINSVMKVSPRYTLLSWSPTPQSTDECIVMLLVKTPLSEVGRVLREVGLKPLQIE